MNGRTCLHRGAAPVGKAPKRLLRGAMGGREGSALTINILDEARGAGHIIHLSPGRSGSSAASICPWRSGTSPCPLPARSGSTCSGGAGRSGGEASRVRWVRAHGAPKGPVSASHKLIWAAEGREAHLVEKSKLIFICCGERSAPRARRWWLGSSRRKRAARRTPCAAEASRSSSERMLTQESAHGVRRHKPSPRMLTFRSNPAPPSSLQQLVRRIPEKKKES